MWKLMFTGDTVTGYERQQVIDGIARLLERSRESVAKELFSGKPVCIEEVESEEEAIEWRRKFADRGALLIALPGDEQTPFGSRYAGADPANINVAEPTMASVFARLPAVRRRNQAFMILGMLALSLAVVLAVVFIFSA